ncbi:MAG TPA: hypothetical protein VK536_06190 [Candidatus Limnocylindrales bacterium]|nr:hypothetical protein [Candidatus Limnocylindrales bacterium]
MNKKTIVLASIAIIALVIAVIALSESYIVISDYHKSPTSTPTPSPQTTIAPTATPNLSSAISDAGNQYINLNFSKSSLNLGGEVFRELVLNVTNICKSNVTIITITYVAKDGSNGTWPASGYQVLSPNSSASSGWATPIQLSSPTSLNSITVYYQVADQIYHHTINTFTVEQAT